MKFQVLSLALLVSSLSFCQVQDKQALKTEKKANNLVYKGNELLEEIIL